MIMDKVFGHQMKHQQQNNPFRRKKDLTNEKKKVIL